MQRSLTKHVAGILAATILLSTVHGQEPTPHTVPGARLPASAISPLVRETMEEVLARAHTIPTDSHVRGMWNGEDGQWFVPPESAKAATRSGQQSIINQWGDPRMGIGFPQGADVHEVWAAGHGAAPTTAVRFVAYRADRQVAATDWLTLGLSMSRCTLDFEAIDRLEVQIVPVAGRQGWIALDDLAFTPSGAARRVLDFEALPPRQTLTGTGHGGLQWEQGTGFQGDPEDIVPAPRAPRSAPEPVDEPYFQPMANAGTTPTLWQDFDTVRQGDPGATLIPPDTCGAAGPDHFVSITNSNLSVYRKSDGARLLSTSLRVFWPGSTGTVGDPRIVFDVHDQRFVAMATNFSGSSTIYVAYSASADPTGTWFKFSYQTDQDFDVGRWPDYPTLGVDARGIYLGAYMVGGSARMTIWAIDKAPLLATPPALGGIFAWRNLPYEGAIQACTTYGDPGGQYLVSRGGSTSLRVRRVDPPMTAPVLVQLGLVTIPSHSNPPGAPALGSTTVISTIDHRPMNAVFRNGSVWTTHGISVNGRAACRWYQIQVAPLSLVQSGTISDELWHYYYPSIAVDAVDNVVLGFSGSHANVYPSAFFTGRIASDPPGETAQPSLYKAGEGPWNRLDGAGRNRYGDYSHTTIDPVDDIGFWTIQEYILPGNQWGTRTARLGFEAYNYGVGLGGTANVPYLRCAARPVIGQNLTFEIGNSAGSGTAAAVFLAGGTKASQPLFGGTLLVHPVLAVPLSITGAQGTIQFTVPASPQIVGVPVYFQVAQADTGAVQGLSFTPGLEVRAASR